MESETMEQREVVMEAAMNAIELAIKKKEDIVRYYRQAAASCQHPAGRRMFEVVLEDELEYLEGLKRVLSDAKAELPMSSTDDQIEAILRTVRDRERLGMACSLDDMEAFRIAMDMEKEAYHFYMEQAARSRDATQRLIFERLAREEERHYEVFSETHAFLNDTGNWFMWDEHSIVEG